MKLNYDYKITNGKYEAVYKCIVENWRGVKLRRLTVAKSKADANRFPEHIFITEYSKP